MRIDAFGISNTGHVREHNEDTILLAGEQGLYLVADGMGGHACGEIASRISAEVIAQAIAGGASLNDAIVQAHQAVVAAAEADPAAAGMGTTVVTLLLEQNRFRLAWVGDSRAYRWRDGELCLLSRDHSYLEWLRDNDVPVEEARTHPKRNIITQSVGIGDPCPDTVSGDCHAGDRFLLCSDGLNDELTDEDIADAFRPASDARATANALVQAALAAGGRDNISVIIADVTATAGGQAATVTAQVKARVSRWFGINGAGK